VTVGERWREKEQNKIGNRYSQTRAIAVGLIVFGAGAALEMKK